MSSLSSAREEQGCSSYKWEHFSELVQSLTESLFDWVAECLELWT